MCIKHKEAPTARWQKKACRSGLITMAEGNLKKYKKGTLNYIKKNKPSSREVCFGYLFP